MASDAGNLRINVTAQIAGLKDGMLKATATVNKFRRDAGKGLDAVKDAVFSVSGALTGLGGALSIAGFASLVKNTMDSQDNLAKLSERLGVTTQKLSAFHLQANLSGVGAEGFDTAIQKMTINLQDAAIGTGTAQEAIKKLNLDIYDLASKSPEDAYLAISDAIKGVTSKSEQLSIVTDIFGRKSGAMANMLAEGKEGFDAAASKAEAFGISINRVDAAKIEAANDSFTELSASVEGAATRVALRLSPAMKDLADNTARNITMFAKFLGFRTDEEQLNHLYEERVKLISHLSNLDRLKMDDSVSRKRLESVRAEITALTDKASAQKVVDDAAKKESVAIQEITRVKLEQADAERVAKEAKKAGAESAKKQLDEELATMQRNRDAETEMFAEMQAEQDSKLEWRRIYNQADLEFAQNEYKTKVDIAAAEAALNQSKIDAVKGTFEVGATLMNAQSKKLFKIGKASAIASALINTYEAVTKTMASVPYPFNIPLAIAQGVAGMVQVQNIKSQQFSGAREFGGPVVKGRSYLVGEKGPEIITPNQSGMVTANKDIGGGSNKNVSLNISTLDTKSMADMFKNNRQLLYNTILEAMNEDGRRFA